MIDKNRIAALEERVATLERRMGSVDIIAETLPVSEGTDSDWWREYVEREGTLDRYPTMHTYICEPDSHTHDLA